MLRTIAKIRIQKKISIYFGWFGVRRKLISETKRKSCSCVLINVSQIICNKHVSAKYSSIAANLYEGFHSKRLQWWHIGQIPNQIPTGTWRTGNYLEFSYRIIEKLVNFFSFDFIFSLQMQLERQQFEATINKLNEYFAEAEKGSCSTYWWAFDLKWTKYPWRFCFLLLIHEYRFDFQWRMFGMYNSLFSLLVHGNTLRKSKYRYSMRFFSLNCYKLFNTLNFCSFICSVFERYPSILVNRMNEFTIQRVYK